MKDILPLIVVAGAVYFFMKSQGSSVGANSSSVGTATAQGVLPGDPRIAAGTLPTGTPVLSPYSGMVTYGNQIIMSGCAAGSNCGGSGILTGLSGVWNV